MLDPFCLCQTILNRGRQALDTNLYYWAKFWLNRSHGPTFEWRFIELHTGATDELLLNKTHVYIVRFYCSRFTIVSWSPSYCKGALHATQIMRIVYWYKVQGISENPFLLCNKFKLYWDGRWDYTFLLVTCKIIIWTWLIQNHHQLTFAAGVLCLTI